MNRRSRTKRPTARERVGELPDAQRGLDATFLPIALGQALAAIEALTLRGIYRKDGLLRGVSARGAVPGTKRHKLLSVLDSAHTPRVLGVLTLAASVSLLFSRGNRRSQIASSAIIGACNRLNELRTPYGRDGADQMTGIITQYRLLSALIPDRQRSDDIFLRAVNLQAGLSYFVSGVSKLFGSSWVQGDALQEVLNTESYGNGPAARILRGRPRLTRLLTWITPLWEIAFPLIYVVPSVAARMGLLAVKAFHVSVAAVMELPRFVWGFSGSHGAVRYVIESRQKAKAVATNFEKTALVAAAGVTVISAVHATTQRRLDHDRRRGLKGTKLLRVEDGVIEYRHTPPTSPHADPKMAPVIVLESGLGTALETWSWVTEAISDECHVVSYHRRGYGQTTASLPARDAVSAVVNSVESTGPLIVVAHSIGLLAVASYAGQSLGGRKIIGTILVDGTDPDLLAQDASDRRRLGKFLQSQLGTAFMAVTGIYNFVPSAVTRQYAFAPDDQSGVVQFAFSPRNIYGAVREYLESRTSGVLDSLTTVERRFVVASGENNTQQAALAEKLGAEYYVIDEATHRSILGNRRHAWVLGEIVARVVRNVI